MTVRTDIAESTVKRTTLTASVTQFLDKRSKWFVLTILILLIAPYFRPEIVIHIDNQVPMLVYKFWGLAAVVLSIVLGIVYSEKQAFIALMGAFVLTALCSTLVNNGGFETWAVRWLPCLGITCLVAAAQKLCKRDFFIALFAVSFALELVNFTSVLLFPQGLWTTDLVSVGANFFFDHRNNAYRILFPMLLSTCLLDTFSGKRFSVRTAVSVALAAAQVLIAPSTTSSIALLLFAVLFLAIQFRIGRRIINGVSILAASLVAFALLVVLRVQNYFGPWMASVLGKTTSLTGRTEIWDFVFDMINRKTLLLGYGVSGHNSLVVNGRTYAHAHNEFLDVWLNSGLIGVILLLVLLALAAYSLCRFRTSYAVAVTALVLGAYFVIGVTEVIVCPSFFLVLAAAFYGPPVWCDLSAEEGEQVNAL